MKYYWLNDGLHVFEHIWFIPEAHLRGRLRSSVTPPGFSSDCLMMWKTSTKFRKKISRRPIKWCAFRSVIDWFTAQNTMTDFHRICGHFIKFLIVMIHDGSCAICLPSNHLCVWIWTNHTQTNPTALYLFPILCSKPQIIIDSLNCFVIFFNNLIKI